MSINNIIAQGKSADGASLKLRPPPTNFYTKRVNNSNIKTPRPKDGIQKFLSVSTTAQQFLPPQPELSQFNRIRQNNSSLSFPKLTKYTPANSEHSFDTTDESADPPKELKIKVDELKPEVKNLLDTATNAEFKEYLQIIFSVLNTMGIYLKKNQERQTDTDLFIGIESWLKSYVDYLSGDITAPPPLAFRTPAGYAITAKALTPSEIAEKTR